MVTGAGRGIGRALALALSRLGYPVGIQARSADQLEVVIGEIEAQGGRAISVPGDVTNRNSADELVGRTVESFGPLAVAVACAGQAGSAPLLRLTAEAFESMMRVNALGVLHLMQAAGGVMKAQRSGGRVIVVASTAAVKGFKYTAAYSASKHAVLGLVRSAALEWARDGITVNAVCPGWVDTEILDATIANIADKTGNSLEEARQQIEKMVPMGEVLKPEEVAGMVEYLVTPGARHLTGQALVIDGGETL